jgi:hypothetical protein
METPDYKSTLLKLFSLADVVDLYHPRHCVAAKKWLKNAQDISMHEVAFDSHYLC